MATNFETAVLRESVVSLNTSILYIWYFYFFHLATDSVFVKPGTRPHQEYGRSFSNVRICIPTWNEIPVAFPNSSPWAWRAISFLQPHHYFPRWRQGDYNLPNVCSVWFDLCNVSGQFAKRQPKYSESRVALAATPSAELSTHMFSPDPHGEDDWVHTNPSKAHILLLSTGSLDMFTLSYNFFKQSYLDIFPSLVEAI